MNQNQTRKGRNLAGHQGHPLVYLEAKKPHYFYSLNPRVLILQLRLYPKPGTTIKSLFLVGAHISLCITKDHSGGLMNINRSIIYP